MCLVVKSRNQNLLSEELENRVHCFAVFVLQWVSHHMMAVDQGRAVDKRLADKTGEPRMFRAVEQLVSRH